ncbi:MAG: hypothetical protein JXM71_01325 [Spirochaetales bacterium]|nr:hypothetical protein [Spirochaetales bacterium]
MKFKTIFVLFNVILIFSFAFVFLMPFFLLGLNYSARFWLGNWPLFLFFLIILAGFNAFFAFNWRLFTLLESEDWEGLGSLLSERVFEKKRRDRRTIKLLVNTALLRGDMATVERLESVLRADRPRALRRDAVLFGAARLLKNDAVASEAFMAEFADGAGVDNPRWIAFYHAFARVVGGHSSEAAATLEPLMSSREPVLAVLAAYLAGTLCAAQADPATRLRLTEGAEQKRATIAARYPEKSWAREVERAKTEIHVVILSRILDEASAWLHPHERAGIDGAGLPSEAKS